MRLAPTPHPPTQHLTHHVTPLLLVRISSHIFALTDDCEFTLILVRTLVLSLPSYLSLVPYSL